MKRDGEAIHTLLTGEISGPDVSPANPKIWDKSMGVFELQKRSFWGDFKAPFGG